MLPAVYKKVHSTPSNGLVIIPVVEDEQLKNSLIPITKINMTLHLRAEHYDS